MYRSEDGLLAMQRQTIDRALYVVGRDVSAVPELELLPARLWKVAK